MDEKPPLQNCLIVTDDKAGTRAQAMALAAALECAPHIETVSLKKWASLLPLGWIKNSKNIYRQKFDFAVAPDLVIAAGRGAVPVAMQLKQRGKTVIFLQNPYIDPVHFDVVIAPRHDNLKAGNVIETTGALSKINGAVLTASRENWRARLEIFPAPRVAVLIGGKSSLYDIDDNAAGHLATQLKKLQSDYQASLFITVSRRTSESAAAILQNALQGKDVYFWDGANHNQADNPYAGFLAWADFILVTEDSVSMHCEAAATGKPIYTLALPKRRKARWLGRGQKFARFYQDLKRLGAARPFQGALEPFQYEKLNEAARVASELKQRQII